MITIPSIKNSQLAPAALSLALATASLPAQDIHLIAGAQSQAQNTPLYFQNAGTLGTNAGFVFPLTLATNGDYAGYYYTASLTPIANQTGFPNAPAPGTRVRLRFTAVSGPANGSFGVWDVPGFNPDEDPATALSFSLPAGTTNGASSILLSENNGEPGADPYGHIHGRRFSATRPGLYVVTVQIYDAATNGPGGGPIHQPSSPLPIYFQAGITIASFAHNGGSVTLQFATATGKTYYVQSTPTPANPGSWQNLAGPFTGNNALRTVSDSNISSSARFYRLRVTTP